MKDISEQDMDFSVTINEETPVSAQTKPNIEKPQPLPNTSQQPTQSSEKIDFTNFLQHANNPIVVFFTLFFKGLAIACFLLLGIFGVSEALVFILVVLLNSFDFWFVKNVSGRILVGLRWWNEVKEDGSEVWIFESDHEKRGVSIDTTIFWMSLYITPAFWAVFVILELIGLKFMWFLACLIGFILTFSNTFGYYKCSGEQKKKIKGFISDKGQQGFSKILQFGVSTFGNQNKM